MASLVVLQILQNLILPSWTYPVKLGDYLRVERLGRARHPFTRQNTGIRPLFWSLASAPLGLKATTGVPPAACSIFWITSERAAVKAKPIEIVALALRF